MKKSISKNIHRKMSLFEIIFICILLLYSAAVLFLFLWSFVSSLRSAFGVRNYPWNLFSHFTFENYVSVFNVFATLKRVQGELKVVFFEEIYLNSIFYAGGSAVVQTFCTALVAYCTSKYKGPISSVIHYVVVVTLIFPVVGNLASMLNVTRALNFYDNMFGMWVMKFSFNNMYYFIFYAAFERISWDYAESAFIDGASHFSVFFRIMLPLALPLLGTVCLLNFIQYWNDFETPYMFLPNHTTAAVGLYMAVNFSGGMAAEIDIPTQMATAFMVFLPVFVLFIIFRKKIMGNLTEGGLKE